jgi:hypothetical protein
MATYKITGKDVSGKRFVINTDTPWNYNIWRGTVWVKTPENKWKKSKEIWN